jgi:hypothetical protein
LSGAGRRGVRPVVSSAGTASPYASQEYREAIGALYTVTYQIKSMVKGRVPELDFVVPRLEGPWWAEDRADFAEGSKDGKEVRRVAGVFSGEHWIG